MAKPKFIAIQLPLPIEEATIELPLTRDYIALIDFIDADLALLKWTAEGTRPDHIYAKRAKRIRGVGQVTYLLHRVVLSRMLDRPLLETEFTDHINHNTLDNRRANLRLSTSSENNSNRVISSNNTSGYKGVARHTMSKRWRGYISFNGKTYHLGMFDTAEDAAHAYDKAARELHGDFAYLNFPDDA